MLFRSYEIYVENSESGLKLYDYIIKVGNKFNLKPGCPNVIERIEGALLSYGNDMDNNDNPYECGLDKYVNLESNIEFLGKKALQKVKLEGIKRKLMGVKIDHNEINVSKSSNVSLLNRIRSNPGIYIEGVGVNAKVFTKGVSSINNQKEVLFILNGVQVGTFSQIVNILNPESIKSITVLKNANDIAIYGFRGSGGVILIKTK